jgi:hypothetical protein
MPLVGTELLELLIAMTDKNPKMKKKTPPGATLIARLREGRLRREQEVAEREAAKSEKPSVKVESEKRPKIKVESTEVEIAEMPVVASAKQMPAVRKPGSVDLIHRDVSIQDLRPFTDDYNQLTEEIRLAGRFAAIGLVAQGMRLARLRDDELFKGHYQTFEEYCRTEHTMSATYAYRLIRIAEMAERLAEDSHKHLSAKHHGQLHDAMPDPFEVMLGLGHRHIMALLPLEPATAEDLLVKGIPLPDEHGKRIPIEKATEQQIRAALKALIPAAELKPARTNKSVPHTRTVKTLTDIVEVLDDWADWLDKGPSPEKLADRIGIGREATKLVHKILKASERLVESLENAKKSGQ